VAAGEEAPKETIKFKFGAMGLQYIAQKKPDGSQGTKMSGMWSMASNKPSWTCPASRRAAHTCSVPSPSKMLKKGSKPLLTARGSNCAQLLQ